MRFKRNIEGLFQAPALEELDLRGNPGTFIILLTTYNDSLAIKQLVSRSDPIFCRTIF